MSEPVKPSIKMKACKGIVRKLVNELPLGCREESTVGIGSDIAGESSMATDSPFSDPLNAC